MPDAPTTLTLPGTYWSPAFQPPTQPLALVYNDTHPRFAYPFINGDGTQSGWYKFALASVGDNMGLAISQSSSMHVCRPSAVSLIPRFAVNEASAGFMMLASGPYAMPSDPLDTVARPWKISGQQSGQIFGRIPAPVYSHIGGRYDRWGRNGNIYIGGDNYFPGIDSPYWGGGVGAVGPVNKSLDGRALVLNGEQAPLLTKLSNIRNDVPLYVKYAFVDAFGRETYCSPATVVPVAEAFGSVGTFVVFLIPQAGPYCCSGYHIYAGYDQEDMRRQPVLNVSGLKEYVWPWHLTQIVLHSVCETGPVAEPDGIVKSPLMEIQRGIGLGEDVFDLASIYSLYCPIHLPYRDSSVHPGRYIGDYRKKCIIVHQNNYDGYPLVTNIPMVAIEANGDTLDGLILKSDYAYAGITFRDWANSDRAMGITVRRCKTAMLAMESYGVLIDERCSKPNAHTCSELTIDRCELGGTVPIKIEGNQSAKITLRDNVYGPHAELSVSPSDTVGTVYACTSCWIDIDGIIGVNGLFRSLVGGNAPNGDFKVDIHGGVFVDIGGNTIVTVGGINGGDVRITGSGQINAGDTIAWLRAVESPVSLSTKIRLDITFDGRSSCLSFMLNKMSIESNVKVHEVVAPTEPEWSAMGMPLVTNEGFRYSDKIQTRFTYGVPAGTESALPVYRP